MLTLFHVEVQQDEAEQALQPAEAPAGALLRARDLAGADASQPPAAVPRARRLSPHRPSAAGREGRGARRRAQRSLLVRLGQEVQALPRGDEHEPRWKAYRGSSALLAATLARILKPGTYGSPDPLPSWGELRREATASACLPSSLERRSYDPRVADQENQPLAQCSRSSEPSLTGFVSTFDPDQLTARQHELEAAMGAPGFWDDQQRRRPHLHRARPRHPAARPLRPAERRGRGGPRALRARSVARGRAARPARARRGGALPPAGGRALRRPVRRRATRSSRSTPAPAAPMRRTGPR